MARIRLRDLLLVATSGAFVTLLLAFSGYAQVLWPLYAVPIILASLAYGLSGSIATVAIAFVLLAAMLAFGGPGGSPAVTADAAIGVGLGMSALAASGIVLGYRERAARRREALLEGAAIRESLSGLYTAAYFDSRLAEEVQRALRYGTRLVLVRFSIDRAAEISNTYGTHRYEQLVRQVAEIVALWTRSTDVLAHTGTAELGLILPAADSDQAAGVAERIREGVKAATFAGDAVQPSLSVTLSLGVATHPESGTDGALRAAAGEALRRAQGAGGDRAVFAAWAGFDAAPDRHAAHTEATPR